MQFGGAARQSEANTVALPAMRLRLTVVDADGTTSFVVPGYALKMVAAACSHDPVRLDELLERLGELDPALAADLSQGLHRAADVAGLPSAIGAAPFRVVDERTRMAALEWELAGLVVVNLEAKRIVQVQNAYGDVRRRDRGRLRRNGRPVPVYYAYELPEEWRIVP